VNGAAPPPLEMRALSKSFGFVHALKAVDLTVNRGEVHALVGQNGSGKSTLVKLLAGIHTPDSHSRIVVDGRLLPLPTRQRDLRAAGIAIVHQDLGLIADKTVVENVAVGRFEPRRWSRTVNWKRESKTVERILARLDASSVAPDALVGDLAPADRSLVAIARALRNQRDGAGILVLDEATKALPRIALETFYQALQKVVSTGGSALMISHNLEEVTRVSDRVTVLRDGSVVGDTLTTADISENQLAYRMLGHDIERRTHRRPQRAASEPAVTVDGLTGAVLRDVDLTLKPGEVVGVTGVVGSGWDELPYLLSGSRRSVAGTVVVGGRRLPLARAKSRQCIAAGIAFLPEHRMDDGLAAGLSVLENITLPRARSNGAPMWAGLNWQRTETAQVIEQLDVRPRDPHRPVGQLSGGNQQKVMLGKWLMGRPKLLVLHEPTQAVDVGAREDILRTISKTAEDGVSIVLASIQPSDLAAVCDRVLVFRDGRVITELPAPDEGAIIDAVYVGPLTVTAPKG
jgi:ribose transport system ATP-binding protein